MWLKKWEELPRLMQETEVEKYYFILRHKRGQLILKRCFDILMSFTLLVILMPIMLVISLSIKLDSKGPVFFRQVRVTQYGRKFKIYKFRTMVESAEKLGGQVTEHNDIRITKIGRKLRKNRLDELPQLFNILFGDMSFVGTRPEVPQYVEQYTNEMKATLLLPAGLTSEASIRYKNEDKFLKGAEDIELIYIKKILPKKMEWNLKEMKKFSVWRDLSTMIKTVIFVGKKKRNRNYKVVALLTNHEDDVFCFRRELLETIQKEGYKLIISCPYGKKIEMLENIKFEFDDVAIDRRGVNPFNDLRLLIHYQKMMKKYKPDMVLSYTVKPNIYGSIAATFLGIPYVNNVTGLGSVLNKKSILKNFIFFLYKIAFTKSSCVFFQNESNMKLALKHGIVKGKYQLIPGSGVNTTYFKLQPYPDGGNGKNGNKVIFNYVGRVLREKGIDDYIDVAKKIKKIYPNTEFNIIGFIEPTENYYIKLFDKLEKEGVLKYRGNQNDVRPWIARAHVIVHPSTYGEGMSNVLLENASSGRPIITTDNPGCKEIVDDGKTGYIYHGGKTEELYEKIKLFLELHNDMRKEMGDLARKKVVKEFERKIVVNEYNKVIKKCI